MEKQFAELKTRLAEISALGGAQAVLGWDQSTHMPPGGAPARGFQLSVLAQIAQEKAIDPALGKLLDNLQEYAESLPFDSDDASLVRVARRDYERAIRVPPEFVARLSVLQAESYQAWTEARPANDFAKVRPYLEKMVELCRELADFFPGYEHIADPLIENADFGMKASSVRSLFASLRALRDALRVRIPAVAWDTLSMGMSDDFEAAIAEGSTLVRLGRAIFGERIP